MCRRLLNRPCEIQSHPRSQVPPELSIAVLAQFDQVDLKHSHCELKRLKCVCSPRFLRREIGIWSYDLIRTRIVRVWRRRALGSSQVSGKRELGFISYASKRARSDNFIGIHGGSVTSCSVTASGLLPGFPGKQRRYVSASSAGAISLHGLLPAFSRVLRIGHLLTALPVFLQSPVALLLASSPIVQTIADLGVRHLR